MPQILRHHPADGDGEADVHADHRRRGAPAVLPRLHSGRVRRLHPHHLKLLQQGGARRRHQPLPPRRRLRRGGASQGGPRARVPRRRLLRRHTRHGGA